MELKYRLLIATALYFFYLPAADLWAGPAGREHPGFKKYWYSQGAEISKFDLRQSRYGEIHEGTAVLIFVTEAMNPKLQVKADAPAEGDVPILKLNATRKFFTGIYPYSVMTSIFSPVDSKSPLPLKVTTSVQEWCGHVFIQLNHRGNSYKVESRSYFETESDMNFTLPEGVLEDALWTQIRLSPQGLPTGKLSILPGTVITRLTHKPLQPVEATAVLSESKQVSLEGNVLMEYAVDFSNGDRILKIFYEKEFPHRIQGWEESYKNFVNGKVLTTEAVRTHTLLKSYWKHHSNKDRELLKSLGLESH